VKPWDGQSRTRLADLEKALGLPTLPPAPDGWPEPLGLAAYRGLPRKIVERVLPHSETDPAALLVHFLVAFGNAVGRAPHAQVEADRHACNLFAAFVGTTGAGRKGTASTQIRRLFERADPTWAKRHVTTGMSTGEGVIQALSSLDDAHEDQVAADEVKDKRLPLREGELSRNGATREHPFTDPAGRLGWPRPQDADQAQASSRREPAHQLSS
jgi:hypothetical protein